jgi:hypothetical protein
MLEFLSVTQAIEDTSNRNFNHKTKKLSYWGE